MSELAGILADDARRHPGPPAGRRSLVQACSPRPSCCGSRARGGRGATSATAHRTTRSRRYLGAAGDPAGDARVLPARAGRLPPRPAAAIRPRRTTSLALQDRGVRAPEPRRRARACGASHGPRLAPLPGRAAPSSRCRAGRAASRWARLVDLRLVRGGAPRTGRRPSVAVGPSRGVPRHARPHPTRRSRAGAAGCGVPRHARPHPTRRSPPVRPDAASRATLADGPAGTAHVKPDMKERRTTREGTGSCGVRSAEGPVTGATAVVRASYRAESTKRAEWPFASQALHRYYSAHYTGRGSTRQRGSEAIVRLVGAVLDLVAGVVGGLPDVVAQVAEVLADVVAEVPDLVARGPPRRRPCAWSPWRSLRLRDSPS